MSILRMEELEARHLPSSAGFSSQPLAVQVAPAGPTTVRAVVVPAAAVIGSGLGGGPAHANPADPGRANGSGTPRSDPFPETAGPHLDDPPGPGSSSGTGDGPH